MNVTLAALAVVAVLGGGDSDTRAAQEAECRVGGEPTQEYGERPPEGFLRYGTRPVVIGCATLASGRRLELVGYQLGRGSRTSLCVDHYDLDRGIGAGCGSNRVQGGGAVDARGWQHSESGPALVQGTARGSVRQVIVRWELGGRLRRQDAALVQVRDGALLDAIDVERRFGLYFAEVPRPARAVTAEALGAAGRTLGLAFFEGFRGAVGQARACYSRPRIVRMRLLDRARAGEKSRLRTAATYPAGYISALDVTVGGRARIHVDLAGSYTGRRVVTLPVRFARRGTVGVDVTAEGLPGASKCRDGPIRHSAPRTLVVRVR